MRSVRARLEDIIASLDLIFAHLPPNFEAYEADIVMKWFLLKQLEIIGEAAFKLDKDFKRSRPGVEWRKIEATRHILVHDYFDVDWGIVWDILQIHAGPLRVEIAAILHEMDAS